MKRQKFNVNMQEKYFAETTEIKNGKGYWSCLKVEIYESTGKKPLTKNIKIGEYKRDYSSMYKTFYPFRQHDKEYALYSTHYEETKVMELPSCKHLATGPNGFCPVDYHVPYDFKDDCGLDGEFGFVSGCYWGDDSSWKIQYLDLSKINDKKLIGNAKILQDSRMGYVEVPGWLDLKNAISTHWYCVGNPSMKNYDKDDDEKIVTIAEEKRFNLDEEFLPPGPLKNVADDINVCTNWHLREGRLKGKTIDEKINVIWNESPKFKMLRPKGQDDFLKQLIKYNLENNK